MQKAVSKILINKNSED